MCEICTPTVNGSLSRIRSELGIILSRVDTSKLDAKDQLLMHEFRGYAALLFSGADSCSFGFPERRVSKLLAIISDLQRMADERLTDISGTLRAHLSSNLADLELKVSGLTERSLAPASRGFQCNEETI